MKWLFTCMLALTVFLGARHSMAQTLPGSQWWNLSLTLDQIVEAFGKETRACCKLYPGPGCGGTMNSDTNLGATYADFVECLETANTHYGIAINRLLGN